jgi:hypothetical protein
MLNLHFMSASRRPVLPLPADLLGSAVLQVECCSDRLKLLVFYNLGTLICTNEKRCAGIAASYILDTAVKAVVLV